MSLKAEDRIMPAKFTNPLDSIRVASPCDADWESMIGNERQRFCGQCELNVYNLSGMTRREAENLILNSEGRVCARFFKRPDGTVITKDCPVGWAAAKKRLSRMWTAVASLMIAMLTGIGMVSLVNSLRTNQPTGSIFAPAEREPLMGTIPVEKDPTEFEFMGDIDIEETPAVVGRIDESEIMKYKGEVVFED